MSQNINFFPRKPPLANPSARIFSSRGVGPAAADCYVREVLGGVFLQLASFIALEGKSMLFKVANIKVSARRAAAPSTLQSEYRHLPACSVLISLSPTARYEHLSVDSLLRICTTCRPRLTILLHDVV